MGWRTAIKSQNVRAIVSYEPGSNFIFPKGEVPPPMPSSGGPLEAVGVPLSDFMKLTKIPIVIYLRRQYSGATDRQIRARTSGAYVWRWRGYGGMP